VSLEEFSDIFYHDVIIEDLTMWRVSMVTLIECKDLEGAREALAQRAPIF
jgi:hypothetical protein